MCRINNTERKNTVCGTNCLKTSSTELKHFSKPSHVVARFANIENHMTKNVESTCCIEAEPTLSEVVYENEVKTKSSLAVCKKTWLFRGRCKKRVRFLDEIQPRYSLCERFVRFFHFIWTCTRTVTTVLSKSEFFYCFNIVMLEFYFVVFPYLQFCFEFPQNKCIQTRLLFVSFYLITIFQ